jgi:hypothetical protein
MHRERQLRTDKRMREWRSIRLRGLKERHLGKIILHLLLNSSSSNREERNRNNLETPKLRLSL